MKNMTFDVPTLARATGKSRQATHKQVAKIARGEATTFCGASATAKLVRGRGGKNGFRYLLTFNQPIPVELDAALSLRSTSFEGALKTDEKAVSQRNQTYEIIAPLLSIKPHSSEMAEAVRAAAATTGKTENWIRGKLRAYRNEGMAGLGRKKRADSGERRVIMSRRYDKALAAGGVSTETIRATARSMDLYIAGLFKKGETYALVRRHAKRKLKELTRAAGFDPGEPELNRICRVPDNVINRGMPLRAVHRFKADRRAYEDIKPRIRRTTAGLAPGDVLMADATKLDIAMAREDGSIYFPPCMLWMDLATRYVWVFLYFPEKGKGLANVHGIETFLSVVAELGCPKSIYADNGPEYNFTSFIDDAMKLVDDHGRPLMRFDLLGNSVRKSNTINSIPHNPQGKAPVEGWFGLWRHSLKGIQGYVGGDRTKMQTPNVGRKAEVFPGTPEQLSAVIGQTVGLYNTTPQRGDLKGKSPREVWEKAIAEGWQKTAVNPDAMRVAFSNEVPRVVRQGCFRHDNRLWSCPELQAYQGHNISVRVPKYGDWSRLPVFAEGKLLGVATPERAFDVLDPDGAREAHRRQKLHRDGLRRLASSVPDLDVINERAATLAELGAMPSAPVLRILQPSDKGAEVLEALSETEEQRDRRHHDEWERELQARQRMLDEDRERRERDAV